ncbi:MAG: hypothetical protein LBT00_00760 [Spirochaetaceae bacterium]|jgi:hypothetical protein|nr:hypothetical protein [Spirochaetaceae bacterium]
MNSKSFFLAFYFSLTLIFLASISGCDKLSFPDFGIKETPDQQKPSLPTSPPAPSPSIPQSRVWYVAADGNDSHTGTDSSSMLATVPAALSRIRSIYRSGNWPKGESAVIIIKGRIVAPKNLGSNETMVEVSGKGNYPPIVLQGDPVTGGILDVNRKGDDGQVLYIANNKVTLGDKLTLTGGNQLWGGAVCIGTAGSESEGEFIMAGGEISGNTGALGGAVMIYKGSMVMSGGVIKNNRNNYKNDGGANGNGGAIYVHEYTTFTMTDGTIELNGGDSEAEKGGALFVEGKGVATMEGGKILNNASFSQGGGVYITYYGTFNMSDGLIQGNTSGEGGGLFVNDSGVITMEDGEILNNRAVSQGGGAYITGKGTFNMKDGIIKGNSSGKNGGVYTAFGGTFNKTGGTVAGNTP